jgi:hypothetical protein
MAGPRTYLIRAQLLCHDVRLNTWIEIRQVLEREPTEAEALHLLWPTGEAVVAKNWCEDCPFELFNFTIRPMDDPPAA